MKTVIINKVLKVVEALAWTKKTWLARNGVGLPQLKNHPKMTFQKTHGSALTWQRLMTWVTLDLVFLIALPFVISSSDREQNSRFCSHAQESYHVFLFQLIIFSKKASQREGVHNHSNFF